MTTKFLMTRDIAGYNGFGLCDSDVKFNALLTAGVAQSFTLPEDNDYYIVIFSPSIGGNIWVDVTTTAAAPSGAMASTTAEHNPQARQYPKGTTVSVITEDATDVEFGAIVYAAPPFTSQV
jgi:hypothetical protein